MKKTIYLLAVMVLGLAATAPALAQGYGAPAGILEGYTAPPTNIPEGNAAPPAGSNIPSDVTADIPTNIPAGVNIPSTMGPPAGEQMGPSDAQLQAQQRGEEMQEKGEEMQKQGEAKQLAGMKKGAAGMERALKQFENQFAKLQKSGLQLSDTTQQNLISIRTDIEKIKSAQTVSDLEGVDQDAVQEKLSSLGDEIGGYSQMLGLKKMLASMNRGVVSFEKQLVKFNRQGLTIPATVTDDFTKLKDGLKIINDAKNPDDLKDVNPDELGDLMTKVNESRPQLEMLSKWPRILKQANQQITSFKKQLTKTKALVDKLSAQGVDVSADYATFESDVTALQTARDEADALIKAGQSEEAFTKMEDEFFNKLDNAGEHQRIIQNMANLSRFVPEFKKGMALAKTQITKLNKKKVNTTELQSIYNQALAKGNEIVAMIKAKSTDDEAMVALMDEMESLKQQFQDKADELAGGKVMPWDAKTPSTVPSLSIPKGFDKALEKVNAASK